MSTVTPIIDHVEDLLAGDERARTTRSTSSCSPRTCSAPTARSSNFGGGNTSAKGTATDHAGREVDVMWVKGSGCDLATMGAEHFTALRLDEMLPLIERDEMSDEDMVAYLARCQLDPAMPRASIETLLHAFVPAPHVHHTHPDGDQRARRHAPTASGSSRECFGDEAAWIPYIRPGFTLVQAGRRGGARQPGPEARRARQARPGRVGRHAPRRPTGARSRSSTRPSRSSTSAPATRRASAARSRRADARSRSSLRELLPAIRGAVSSERAKVLTVDTSRARARVRLLARRPRELVDGRRACPDHLVHTKRLPLWIPFDPETDDADDAARRGSPSARRPTATTTAPTSSASRRRTTEPADPDARDRPRSSTSGWSPSARRPRRRRSRATSTTARSR